MIDEDSKEAGHPVRSSDTPLGKSAKRSPADKVYSFAVAVLFVCAIGYSIASRTLHLSSATLFT